MVWHTCKCSGLQEPKIKHLHAEKCPERKKDFPLFRESLLERQSFDRFTDSLYGGDALKHVAVSLDTWARARSGGSFEEACIVMANECLIASQCIKELEAEVQALYEDQAGESI